jgi:predicted metal-dependent hydrolase
MSLTVSAERCRAMTDLVVRKIPWEFGPGIPFLWQPANPNFGIFCNAFTFIAVPFEKYIISSLREAKDRLAQDSGVASEAEAFLRQEAQHSSAHRKHMLALIATYPELEGTYQRACKSYEDLIEEHPVEFHAAYIANLEATFTPLFKVFLDNRESMFGPGDQRVASLMGWHFVEEIEHRSSGLILYEHLSPSRWYRTKNFRKTFNHTSEVMAEIARDFDRIVPFEDRGASAEELMSPALMVNELRFRGPGGSRRRARHSGAPTLFHSVPTTQIAKMLWRLALSQTPNHDPAHQPLPAWADTWMREYERGTDMTTFFGASTPADGSGR